MSQEFSAKTVEEAIAKGLGELGLSRDAVKVEIVREPTRGILGLGGEEARVRLTPMMIDEPNLDDTAAMAGKMLETLLDGMGLHARVESLPDDASDSPSAFVLNLIGDDLGVLIGRRGETLRATWGEFNVQKKLGTIPGAHRKNGLQLIVPLSPAALASARTAWELPAMTSASPSAPSARLGLLWQCSHAAY